MVLGPNFGRTKFAMTGQWGNVVNCLLICVLLNITLYASTDLLDQASQASI